MNLLSMHHNYLLVRNAAEESLLNLRSIDNISDEVILLARLYSYGFRGHVIGAFHATAQALKGLDPSKAASVEIQNIIRELSVLGALSMDAIPNNFRAVLGTFSRYDLGLSCILRNFNGALETQLSNELRTIQCHFIRAMERVTASSGIVVNRDDEIAEQASFIVPNLGITIVPLVYGDQHSWNMAFLSGHILDVPRHAHQEGIEIHLGIGNLHGETCLGKHRAEVKEGYAMPIAHGVPHGFLNHSQHDHRLPFIFGSRKLGGWGIIPDVKPCPIDPRELASVSSSSKAMNGLIFLDREIDSALKARGNVRRNLISPDRTFSPSTGGLTLSIACIAADEAVQESDRFRIICVARGHGQIEIGRAKAALSPHVYFGIPAGAQAKVIAGVDAPLVLLETMFVEELPCFI